jgi:hypothetical protein
MGPATGKSGWVGSPQRHKTKGSERHDVRITPHSGRIADIGGRLKSATTGLMHHSKPHSFRSHPHLASVLLQVRKSANIHAISGVIRGIPVKYFLGGIGLASSISGTRKDNVEV